MPKTTTILDGSLPFARYADGVTLCRVKGKNLFETNFVLPPVGQVILIDPLFLAPEMEITQLHLMGIIVEA